MARVNRKPKVSRPTRKKLSKREKQKALRSIDDSVSSLAAIDKQLTIMIRQLKKHQTGSRVAKWGTTAGSVASTILCYTPFALFGVVGLAASSYGGMLASKHDEDVTNKSQRRIQGLAKKAKISLEKTNRILTSVFDKALVAHGFHGAYGALGNARRLATLGKVGVKATGKALGAVGAVISVVDAIYTTSKGFGSLNDARKLQREIRAAQSKIKRERVGLQREL